MSNVRANTSIPSDTLFDRDMFTDNIGRETFLPTDLSYYTRLCDTDVFLVRRIWKVDGKFFGKNFVFCKPVCGERVMYFFLW